MFGRSADPYTIPSFLRHYNNNNNNSIPPYLSENTGYDSLKQGRRAAKIKGLEGARKPQDECERERKFCKIPLVSYQYFVQY